MRVHDVDESPVTILHHAAVSVRDVGESLRFYRDGIGLEVLIDTVLEADLEPLLGVHTRLVRTVLLGDTNHDDAGIINLLDLGLASIADAAAQSGAPGRGVFLLALQVDVATVLTRLAQMGLGGTPRAIIMPGAEWPRQWSILTASWSNSCPAGA